MLSYDAIQSFLARPVHYSHSAAGDFLQQLVIAKMTPAAEVICPVALMAPESEGEPAKAFAAKAFEGILG